MSEWVDTPLHHVADVIRGVTFRKEQASLADTSGRVPVVRATNFNEDGLIESSELVFVDEYLVAPSQRLRENDVLITMSTGSLLAIGKSTRIRQARSEAFGGFLAVIRPKMDEVIQPEFLGLYLTTDEVRGRWRELARGTSIRNLNQGGMGALRAPLPSLAEQRRIVDVMAAVDAQIEALAGEAERSRVAYRNATSLLWSEADGQEAEPRSMGEMMTLDIKRMTLAHDEVYSIAGVLGSGQGMIDKGQSQGSETKYRAMNVLRTDQVVMRKLTAWEGPITVVPAAFDRFLASNEFPTFTLNSGVNSAWMRHVCRTQRLWDEMKNRVTGSVQRRKRLSPEQLLAVRLPVPSAGIQGRVAGALDELDRERDCTVLELATLRTFRSTLLTSLLSQDVEIPESYDEVLAAEFEVVS